MLDDGEKIVVTINSYLKNFGKVPIKKLLKS